MGKIDSDVDLRNRLIEAQEKLRQQDELLKELTAEPITTGTIKGVSKDGKQALLSTGSGAPLIVSKPKAVQRLFPGDFVAVAPTGNILTVYSDDDFSISGGSMHMVKAKHDKQGLVEMEAGDTGQPVIVHGGRFMTKVNVGDRVLIDGVKIIHNFGPQDRVNLSTRFAADRVAEVTWDDIGGLADAKQELKEAIELPFFHADHFKAYGKRPSKGVLLYGPPGCGKTMLGKAAANSLRKSVGAKSGTGFLYIKGPEILSQWVGVAEQTVRAIFTHTRQHFAEHKFPCIVFLDEADAILGKRGTGKSADMEKTIVPMFLAEMDGFEDSGAIVILATNRADTLDPAVTRDGRVDRKIRVGRPDQKTTAEMLSVKLRGIPISGHDPSVEGAEELFSDKYPLYDVGFGGQGRMTMKLADIVSGAMVHGIVDHATSIALHRDIGKSARKPSGVSVDDVRLAIRRSYTQNIDLNHHDEILEFAEKHGASVTNIRRIAR